MRRPGRTPGKSDTPVTNQDQPRRGAMSPRPVSRPSVDPSAERAFGRPDGVAGSFMGHGDHRDQGEYTPTNQPPQPVLAEAFGPAPATDSQTDDADQHAEASGHPAVEETTATPAAAS